MVVFTSGTPGRATLSTRCNVSAEGRVTLGVGLFRITSKDDAFKLISLTMIGHVIAKPQPKILKRKNKINIVPKENAFQPFWFLKSLANET